MTLEKEIFPAATDSRFIRAVSITSFDIVSKMWEFSLKSAYFLTSGGNSRYRLLPNEPHSDSAARSQRVSERASVPERHRRVREAHPSFNKCSRLSRRGLDPPLLFNPRISQMICRVIYRDYQRKTCLS